MPSRNKDKMLLAKECVVPEPIKKPLTIKIDCMQSGPLQVFYFRPAGAVYNRPLFKTVFTRCFTDIPRTRIT